MKATGKMLLKLPHNEWEHTIDSFTLCWQRLLVYEFNQWLGMCAIDMKDVGVRLSIDGIYCHIGKLGKDFVDMEPDASMKLFVWVKYFGAPPFPVTKVPIEDRFVSLSLGDMKIEGVVNGEFVIGDDELTACIIHHATGPYALHCKR